MNQRAARGCDVVHRASGRMACWRCSGRFGSVRSAPSCHLPRRTISLDYFWWSASGLGAGSTRSCSAGLKRSVAAFAASMVSRSWKRRPIHVCTPCAHQRQGTAAKSTTQFLDIKGNPSSATTSYSNFSRKYFRSRPGSSNHLSEPACRPRSLAAAIAFFISCQPAHGYEARLRCQGSRTGRDGGEVPGRARAAVARRPRARRPRADFSSGLTRNTAPDFIEIALRQGRPSLPGCQTWRLASHRAQPTRTMPR